MRRVGFRVIAVLVGIAGALLLAEIAVRVLLPPPERARVVASDHAQRLDDENAEPAELRVRHGVDDASAEGRLYFHTPTGMRLRANTHAVIDPHRLGGLTVDIRTNSLGHRNRELGPKEDRRVLFIGDSITVQDYLPEEQTIVRLVESLSQGTPEPLETINAGVGAIGLANELAILMETGFATEPDVVVLNWYLNDVQASAGVELVEPAGWLAHSRLAELVAASVAGLEWNRVRRDVSSIPPETDAAWRTQVAEAFPPKPGDYVTDPAAFNQNIQQLFFDWGSAWADGAWERMTPVLVEMKRQADLHGARFLIVAFPVFDQVTAQYVYDYPQERLAAVARELGVPMLDLLPVLRDAVRSLPPGEPLYWDWCHPSPRGSRIVAEAILEFIQRETGGG